MPLEPVVTDLRQTLAASSAGTKAKFLADFAPIHAAWHMAEMNTGQGVFNGKSIGFLSFHHEVVTVYAAKYAPNLSPGPMANPSPPYRSFIDAITDPIQFSHALEGWHNLVHRNPAYGPNFGDPLKNIYMARFWQFHRFIELKFLNWIQHNNLNYDNLNHTVL